MVTLNTSTLCRALERYVLLLSLVISCQVNVFAQQATVANIYIDPATSQEDKLKYELLSFSTDQAFRWSHMIRDENRNCIMSIDSMPSPLFQKISSKIPNRTTLRTGGSSTNFAHANGPGYGLLSSELFDENGDFRTNEVCGQSSFAQQMSGAYNDDYCFESNVLDYLLDFTNELGGADIILPVNIYSHFLRDSITILPDHVLFDSLFSETMFMVDRFIDNGDRIAVFEMSNELMFACYRAIASQEYDSEEEYINEFLMIVTEYAKRLRNKYGDDIDISVPIDIIHPNNLWGEAMLALPDSLYGLSLHVYWDIPPP